MRDGVTDPSRLRGQEEMMRCFRVGVDSRAEAIEIENDLDAFYAEIGTNVIDITRRVIGGITFHVVVDDIGLLREGPVVTMVDHSLNPSLVGTLLIFGFDGPEFRSLTDDEVNVLQASTFAIIGQERDVIMCDYL